MYLNSGVDYCNIPVSYNASSWTLQQTTSTEMHPSQLSKTEEHSINTKHSKSLILYLNSFT